MTKIRSNQESKTEALSNKNNQKEIVDDSRLLILHLKDLYRLTNKLKDKFPIIQVNYRKNRTVPRKILSTIKKIKKLEDRIVMSPSQKHGRIFRQNRNNAR